MNAAATILPHQHLTQFLNQPDDAVIYLDSNQIITAVNHTCNACFNAQKTLIGLSLKAFCAPLGLDTAQILKAFSQTKEKIQR